MVDVVELATESNEGFFSRKRMSEGPSENARELAAFLRRAGADVTVCFENAGHGLTDMTNETTRRWHAEKAA